VNRVNPPPAQSAQKWSRHILQNHIISFRFPQKAQAGLAIPHSSSTGKKASD
jgi:hypothetical protein